MLATGGQCKVGFTLVADCLVFCACLLYVDCFWHLVLLNAKCQRVCYPKSARKVSCKNRRTVEIYIWESCQCTNKVWHLINETLQAGLLGAI